jgi:hypothetical protein
MLVATDDYQRRRTMTSEHATVETDDLSLSRRFGSASQAHLKTLPKSETNKCQIYVKAEAVHLRMIDLNLFRVFDAMMLHRSVRKASQILSVSPSAVSHALSRLRQSIDDELFIPTDSGMQPTRRALDLASAVRAGLEKLESALTGKESVPVEAPRTFRIGATDYFIEAGTPKAQFVQTQPEKGEGEASPAVIPEPGKTVIDPAEKKQIPVPVPVVHQPADEIPSPVLVPQTFRLSQRLIEDLARAAIERKIKRRRPWSQQDIVAEAIKEWLRKHVSK